MVNGPIRPLEPSRSARAAEGFTLIELLIIVTILGVLMAAALPSYTQFVRNQRVKTASFDVYSTLVLARSEALTRNGTVTVTPASGTNWASGWQVRAGATVIRDQSAIPEIAITGPASIAYSGSGRLSAPLARPIQVTAPGTGITPRCITVDLSGRPVSRAQPC